jgi:PqqD family protein of HPr-rel-A system
MKSCRIIRRNHDLPFQVLADQVVVVNPRAGKVHLLNGTASRIWALLEHETNAESVLASLREEYLLSSSDQEREVESFLEALEELALAVSVSSASGEP